MFYVVGLGLGDVKDITVKGLEIVKKCDRVYLEAYTSILIDDIIDDMKSFYGKDIIIADREMVESASDVILHNADVEDVALLVVGDPYGATTHTDLVLRARQSNIPTKVVHNASILNAAGCCGLQLYNFGETVSIPFWTESWKPDSFYDKIVENKSRGLHTLCLLDIQVKEPTLESLTKKTRQYLPPRFMSVSQAAQQLVEITKTKPGLSTADLAVGIARVGSETQHIVATSLSNMTETDMGKPLHSLIIVGNIHPVESEFLAQYSTQELTG
ncbi:diphthine methyl ester synthase [Diaphorina citri]|uniref:diphthine methyl ester synthase n=1 Tax=Diaphorina citri TaxID=121845 RepID=A0A1S4E897_DIACI|nr:diphthine methyl ester synthase [Diaphorina citri]XP_017298278.1 diphthine methyl ester synthase [Diaphorina citri]XP_017298279.1 diphthine methyl ester synthase [Diaphorina citri]XP_026677168.1 diphthine methyl ester synthase [Diaphorina citri]